MWILKGRQRQEDEIHNGMINGLTRSNDKHPLKRSLKWPPTWYKRCK